MAPQFGITLGPIGELADPAVIVELACHAESCAWSGFFLWDHLMRPEAGQAILDPWVTLGAVAAGTDRIRIGPMVTPLPRRRPQVVAQQSVALDRLSAGRMILGLGLGVDTGRELSGYGEVTDPAVRGAMLSEGAELIDALWSGETVHFDGSHYVADGVRQVPVPVQRPRIPIWFAARTTNAAPLRRAARYDGLCVIERSADELAAMADRVARERGHLRGFDIAMVVQPGTDPRPYLDAGATWILADLRPPVTAGDVADLIDSGPEGLSGHGTA